MDPPQPCPYMALGVPPDATDAQVKTAYRKLALTCHPDKVTDPVLKTAALDKFHAIQQAYELLGDADKKRQYDTSRRSNVSAASAAEGYSERRRNDTDFTATTPPYSNPFSWFPPPPSGPPPASFFSTSAPDDLNDSASPGLQGNTFHWSTPNVQFFARTYGWPPRSRGRHNYTRSASRPHKSYSSHGRASERSSPRNLHKYFTLMESDSDSDHSSDTDFDSHLDSDSDSDSDPDSDSDHLLASDPAAIFATFRMLQSMHSMHNAPLDLFGQFDTLSYANHLRSRHRNKSSPPSLLGLFDGMFDLSITAEPLVVPSLLSTRRHSSAREARRRRQAIRDRQRDREREQMRRLRRHRKHRSSRASPSRYQDKYDKQDNVQDIDAAPAPKKSAFSFFSLRKSSRRKSKQQVSSKRADTMPSSNFVASFRRKSSRGRSRRDSPQNDDPADKVRNARYHDSNETRNTRTSKYNDPYDDDEIRYASSRHSSKLDRSHKTSSRRRPSRRSTNTEPEYDDDNEDDYDDHSRPIRPSTSRRYEPALKPRSSRRHADGTRSHEHDLDDQETMAQGHQGNPDPRPVPLYRDESVTPRSVAVRSDRYEARRHRTPRSSDAKYDDRPGMTRRTATYAY